MDKKVIRVQALVEESLMRKFKIKAAAEGKSMSEILVEYIKQYVKRTPK